MNESVTYQAIVEQGFQIGLERARQEARERGLHEGFVWLLLHLGSKRFGPPDAAVQAALDAIADQERFLRLSDRLPEVGGGGELLAVE